MYKLEQFKGKEPKPVIMKKYYCYHMGAKTTHCAFFAPASASYDEFPSKKHFGSNMDALFVHGTGKTSKGVNETFLEVVLNDEARVFILLNGWGIDKDTMCQHKDIKGLGEKWTGSSAILSKTKANIPIGNVERTKWKLSLPAEAVVLERTFAKGETIILPHPQSITVNRKTVNRYNLLFARPGKPGSSVVPFPRPRSPTAIKKLMSEKEETVVAPAPNKKCPNWLHDLHMTKTRDAVVADQQEELMLWQTWHPMVDSIYWCYYDHEHGAYPGKYEPAFDYTAYKTYDEFTSHNRQEESHGGFKVFSFPLKEMQKFVVITVHMHVAFVRRFFTRHHTVAFAVLDKNWELEMELHMKMDFGGAEVTHKNKTTAGVNSHEKGIIKSLLEKKIVAGRRFNLVNIDDGYPGTVDKNFLLNCGITPTVSNKRRVLRGIYEQWKGTLNTCTQNTVHLNTGFNFDVRDPSTAFRSLTEATDESKQVMGGFSVNRMLVMKSGVLKVGIEHCDFDVFHSDSTINLEAKDGVFYTDPYFAVVRAGPGKNNVRQFIKHGFETIKIPKGHISPVDPWSGHMDYQVERSNMTREFRNIEGAVIKLVN